MLQYAPVGGSLLGSGSHRGDHNSHHEDTIPFVDIGHHAGSVLKQRLVSHPDEPIHTFFAVDNTNRWVIMYTWLKWQYRVLVGGLSCTAIYRAI